MRERHSAAQGTDPERVGRYEAWPWYAALASCGVGVLGGLVIAVLLDAVSPFSEDKVFWSILAGLTLASAYGVLARGVWAAMNIERPGGAASHAPKIGDVIRSSSGGMATVVELHPQSGGHFRVVIEQEDGTRESLHSRDLVASHRTRQDDERRHEVEP